MMTLLFPIVFGLMVANAIMSIGARNWSAVLGWTSAAILTIPLMVR